MKDQPGVFMLCYHLTHVFHRFFLTLAAVTEVGFGIPALGVNTTVPYRAVIALRSR